MTVKDKQSIQLLFNFHRYTQGSIARLYGISQQRVSYILLEQKNSTVTPLDECIICGLDESKQYYIDGNEDNNHPQNKIMLCEAHKRRIEHLQLRRGEKSVKSLY